jgi:hypothetical protein
MQGGALSNVAFAPFGIDLDALYTPVINKIRVTGVITGANLVSVLESVVPIPLASVRRTPIRE